MITSKVAAGLTDIGFIVLASTLSAVKVIPVKRLALLLDVDRFVNDARALRNFTDNAVATIFIANNEKISTDKKCMLLWQKKFMSTI